MSYYFITPGVSVIDKKNGTYLFKSDTHTFELEGASAQYLIDKILPLLNGNNDIGFVLEQIIDIHPDDLVTHLESLVKAGILSKSNTPIAKANEQSVPVPFANFLNLIRLDKAEATEKLSQAKVVILGLEAYGMQTLFTLQQSGISNFKIVDPFPLELKDLDSFPFLKPCFYEGITAQECLMKYFRENNIPIAIEAGPAQLTTDSLQQFISDCTMCVVCFNKGFTAVNYQINDIALALKMPVLYSESAGHLFYIGPFVIPGKTPCYKCYKMRTIANTNDIEDAVAYEEYLLNKATIHRNGNFIPGASGMASAILATETLKYLLSFGQVTTAGKVLEMNTITFENTRHTILQKPDCNICQKIETRELYSINTLMAIKQSSDLGSMLDMLISPHCGIIRQEILIPKDASEPLYPLVYAAILGNYAYLPQNVFDKFSCSGKGMDDKSARISAAGEAVERYSGGIFFPAEVSYHSYNELGEKAMNPVQLVLYSQDQYKDLGYAPFDPNARIGWINGYSLLNDQMIKVPAVAAVMNYAPKTHSEYFCQTTSNGLAAGANMLNAILSAAMEVIERDAFVITWHNELPCKKIAPLTHPSSDVIDFCRAYEKAGVEIQLYLLPTDTPCYVFMAIAVQISGDGPRIVSGLGAGFSAAKAARSAILEVGQVRPALKERMLLPEIQERIQILRENPQNVADIDDHNIVYAIPDHLSAFDFLFNQPLQDFDWADTLPAEPDKQLQILIDYCKHENTEFVYCNLTPPDMEQLGLYTAKVFMDDFQPIHFGVEQIRLGGKRLFELPKKLGFRKEFSNPTNINIHPHPLA